MPSRNFLSSFCPSWYKWVTFFAQFDFTSVQHKHNTPPWDSQFEQVMLCPRTFSSGRFLAKALDIVWNPLYSSQNTSGIRYRGSVSIWAWTVHWGRGYPVHHKMLEASRGNKTSSLPLWLYGRDGAGSNSYKHKGTNLRSLSYKLVHIFSIKKSRSGVRQLRQVFETFKYRNQNHMATRKAPVTPSDPSLTAWQSSFSFYLGRPHLRKSLLMKEKRSLPSSGLWNSVIFKFCLQ